MAKRDSRASSSARLQEEDILYETPSHRFWVLDVGARGFEVYAAGATHSTRVASIGLSLGLQRAIDEADRRDCDRDVVRPAPGAPKATSEVPEGVASVDGLVDDEANEPERSAERVRA